jgi:hypothetical protein
MLVRQKGSRFNVLIATSSVEQHGNEQCAGHPPTPAPGPFGSRRAAIWENDDSFQETLAKIFV